MASRPRWRDVTAALAPEVTALVEQAVAAIPAPKDGTDGQDGEDGRAPSIEEVTAALAPEVKTLVEQAVAAIPAPKDGVDGQDGTDGADGVAPTLEDVTAALAPEVKSLVEQAVAAIPAPKDGQDGADGRGIKSLLIDRAGELVASMDDGALVNLGQVVGKDGENGKDGKDGFSLEDFACHLQEDGRTIELSFKSGEYEHVATLKWPAPIYCGVFKQDQEYEAGDVVTWGGSAWIAKMKTSAKPDSPDSGWTLFVKRGRDGKDMRKE
jgi:hypothetical protein